MSRTMLRGDDESGISAHLYPAVHYLLYVLFYLLGHRKALWPFLYLIFQYFISRSLPSPSPSHSAVLAHSSVQLISNSASLPLCFAQCLCLSFISIFFLSSPSPTSHLHLGTMSSPSLIFLALLCLLLNDLPCSGKLFSSHFLDCDQT